MSNEIASNQYNIVTYNNTQYEFELILVNEYFNVFIPHSNVEAIVIEDDLNNIFVSATIALNNSRNNLDVFTTYKKGQKQVIQNKSYNFLGSGNDYFLLHLKPKTQNTENVDPSSLKKDIFSIDLQLTIKDEDEIIVGAGEKRRIFSCMDVREYILQTDKRGFSSINEPNFARNNFRVEQLDNTSRVAPSGDIIKYILQQSLKDTNPLFEETWDSGQSKLFYSSPQGFSAYDDIEYLLDYHVAAVTKDNSLLKMQRNGVFSFRSLTDYFSYNRDGENAGPLMQDFFAYEDNVSKPTDTTAPIDKKELVGQSPIKFSFKNITNLANLPNLPEFNFLNRTGLDGYTYLISYGVNTYDLGTKNFYIQQEVNHVDNQKKFIDEHYTKKFGGTNPTTSYYIDNVKKSNIVFEPNFCLPVDSNTFQKYGLNIALKKYIDSSPCISFNTEGFTHRESGRFMSLVNTQMETESVFANLFSGEWFVTKVVHTFSKGGYTNTITGVKTYFYDKVATPTAEEDPSLAEKINKIESLG
jgi:hypothetical protein